MSEMQELCEFFKKRGYTSSSVADYYIQVFRRGNILIRIEDKQEKKEP